MNSSDNLKNIMSKLDHLNQEHSQAQDSPAAAADDQWKIPKTPDGIKQQLLTLLSPEFVNLNPATPEELQGIDDFPCDGCGLCCVRVDSSPYLQGLERKEKDGICRYFDVKRKRCKIYKHRPLICNVKEGYLRLFKDSMSWQEFYFENIKACLQLKEAHKQGKLLKVPHIKI